MTTRKPVTMSREFLPKLATPKERADARDSVAESMARLFPNYIYAREETTDTGKLLVVTYTYEYSRLKAFMNRLKAGLAKYRSRLNLRSI